MFIKYDAQNREYIVECDNCHHQFAYEDHEIILEPYPHFECPICHEWIAAF